MGVVVDTSELIHIERTVVDVRFAELLPEDAVIAAVTVAELQLGVELADTLRRRTERAKFLDDLLVAVPSCPSARPKLGSGPGSTPSRGARER